MTDKQKQAIRILNSLWNANGRLMKLNENGYFLLMDFVVGTHDQCPKVEVEPWVTEPALLTNNYEPYGRFGGATCDAINSELEEKL